MPEIRCSYLSWVEDYIDASQEAEGFIATDEKCKPILGMHFRVHRWDHALIFHPNGSSLRSPYSMERYLFDDI
jgi:hypothetical protein